MMTYRISQNYQIKKKWGNDFFMEEIINQLICNSTGYNQLIYRLIKKQLNYINAIEGVDNDMRCAEMDNLIRLIECLQ